MGGRTVETSIVAAVAVAALVGCGIVDKLRDGPKPTASETASTGAAAAGASSADSFQLFTYTNPKGLSRVCKGNTTTGDAICAGGARLKAEMTTTDPPKLSSFLEGDRTYLQYVNPFDDSSRVAGRYAFLAYYNNEGSLRVCVGRSDVGDLICRNGTSRSSTSVVGTDPKFQDDGSSVDWLNYFNWAEKHPVGTYTFARYHNPDGLVRLCRQSSSDGATICTDHAHRYAAVKGNAKVQWQNYDKQTIIYLGY